MSARPVEALAIMALSMSAVPHWLGANDFWVIQGVMMGTALAAIMGTGNTMQRFTRAVVSMLVGYLAGEFVAQIIAGGVAWVGFASYSIANREGLRFISGCVAFSGWWAVLGVEHVAPAAFKKAAKAGADGLLNRIARMGVGDSTTDRADHYRTGVSLDKTPDDAGNSSDAR